MRRKIKRWAVLGWVLTGLSLFVVKPGDEARNGAPEETYFQSLGHVVQKECRGLPCAVIDLDRLDANIRAVVSRVRAPRSLRIVVKSLPSMGLIRYVLEKAGTRRLMVFHAPHIAPLLRELGELDILMGKPMPAEAARLTLEQEPGSARSVQWLVDTPERLEQYLAVARDLKLRLRINVEIDVGLRRGGARDAGELRALLEKIRANPSRLQFAGFMGYDGHVSHTPSFFGLGNLDRAMKRSFEAMLRSYAGFVREGERFEPAWFKGPGVTLNGGGSHTYAFYESVETPINDLALGSAFVKPSDFEDASLSAHQRALFLALPILKKLSTPPIPFLEPFWGLATAWDPNVARGFYIYGAVWNSKIVHPQGLRPGWFYEPEIRNLLPNQSLVSGSASVRAEVGDYLWLHPREGDALAVYHDIIAVREGKAWARWEPLPVLN